MNSCGAEVGLDEVVEITPMGKKFKIFHVKGSNNNVEVIGGLAEESFLPHWVILTVNMSMGKAEYKGETHHPEKKRDIFQEQHS